TAHLRQAFLDAGRYRLHQSLYAGQTAGIARPPEDPVLEVLGEVLDRKRPSIFLAQSRDDIHRALDFAREHNLPPIIWGAREAYRTADALKDQVRGVFAQMNWGTEPTIEANKPGDALVPVIKDPQRVQTEKRDRWRQQVA